MERSKANSRRITTKRVPAIVAGADSKEDFYSAPLRPIDSSGEEDAKGAIWEQKKRESMRPPSRGLIKGVVGPVNPFS